MCVCVREREREGEGGGREGEGKREKGRGERGKEGARERERERIVYCEHGLPLLGVSRTAKGVVNKHCQGSLVIRTCLLPA